MRPLPVTPLAGAPRFVSGVAVVRGAATPVVDAGLLLGCSDAPAPARFVALKSGRKPVALSVEEVLGISPLSSAMLEELPPLLREAGADLVARIATLDRELLLVLQTARLVPESLWPAMAGEGRP